MTQKFKKTKVLWLVGFYPISNLDWAGIFFKRNADALSKNKNINLTVIHFIKITKLFKKKTDYEKNYNLIRIPIFNFHILNIIGLVELQIIIINFFLFKIINPQIIHGHYFYPFGSCLRFLSNKRKAFVSIIGSDINIDTNKIPKVKKIIKKLDPSKIRFISVSEKLKDKLLSINKSLDINLIYDGLDFEKFKKITPKKNKEKLTFCFVGRLTYEKGFDIIIDLIKYYNKNTNIKWNIVGNGNLNQQLIHNLQYTNNINYYPSLSNSETLSIISESDLMIFPSRFEGIPNVLKEAGYLKVPIITTSVGGIGELLNYGELGTMIYDIEFTHFKNEIDLFIKSSKDHKIKAELLFKNIDNNYSASENMNKLNKLYNNNKIDE